MRVALVHDWLTGMRGGERVLEALVDLFPEATIHTLVHVPGSVAPAIEARPIRTSFIQRLPGAPRRFRQYLPLFPLAAERIAARRVRPGRLDQSLRRPRRPRPARCMSRDLLLHAHALRLGVPGRVRPPAAARHPRGGPPRARRAPALGRRRRPPRGPPRGHLAPRGRPHPDGVGTRGPGHLPAGPHRVVPARRGARRGLRLRVRAGALQAARRGGGRLQPPGVAAQRDRSRGRGGASSPARGSHGALPRLAGRRGAARGGRPLPGVRVPGRGGVRDRPAGGDGGRATRHRLRPRRPDRDGRGRRDRPLLPRSRRPRR